MMNDELLIRWTEQSESILDEQGDVKLKRPYLEAWLSNSSEHRLQVNGIVWFHQGEKQPLTLSKLHGYKTRFGPSFEIPPFGSVICRPQYSAELVQALNDGTELYCFLAHLPWPKPTRPIKMITLGGNWLDQEAFEKIKAK